jgi:hypothetical protein
MTLGRVLVAILIAAAILFPGVELIRFLFSGLFGVYKEISLTDCLLFFMILLQCILLLQRRGEEPHLRAVGNQVEAAKERRPARSPSPKTPPPGNGRSRPRT